MLFFILLLNRLTSLMCCLAVLWSAVFHVTVLANARNGEGQMGIGRVAGESEERRKMSMKAGHIAGMGRKQLEGEGELCPLSASLGVLKLVCSFLFLLQ